jgi:hypothetical protein
VEIKNIIITILYLIIKNLLHRDLLPEENVEFYVSNINFATSNFLDVGHEKQRRFLLINSIHTVPNALFQSLLEFSS